MTSKFPDRSRPLYVLDARELDTATVLRVIAGLGPQSVDHNLSVASFAELR